tara:strand:- start:4 stop:816 length:813 start_codon:yes stop_codon:yes gene_type:complete
MKHNKKRNTAFLYESLIKELTKSIVKQDNDKKEKIVEIIKKYFNNSTVLKKELEIYNSVLAESGLPKDFAAKYIHECKKDFESLDRTKVFNQQTKLIKEMRENVSNSVFSNFISNYRDIASIGQFFNSAESTAKQRLLLESNVVKMVMKTEQKEKEMKHIDNLTYKTFVNKFNTTYENSLTEEQKKLLTNYITSFSNNGLGLKMFINEEIGRLKRQFVESIENKPNDMKYAEKTKKVIGKLQSFSKRPIDESMVKDLFYMQNLAYEVTKR